MKHKCANSASANLNEYISDQLMESQQSAKQSRNEAEQMKDRLKALQEELKHHAGSEDNRSREELVQIRQRCEALEADNARCVLVY
jgi:replicative DNA helicase